MSNIFLTAQSRSGSSHVSETLKILTGYQLGYIMPQFSGNKGNEEHVISYCDIQVMSHNGKWVFHSHSKGTNNNRYLLRAFGMKPVVLIRDVADSLVSVKEQLEAGAEFINFTRPHNWSELDDDLKWDFMITYIAPWFLDYQRSWENHPEALILQFKHMFGQPVDAYLSIFEHVGLESPSNGDILAAHESHRTNYTTGIAGRGEFIPEPFLSRLAELPK